MTRLSLPDDNWAELASPRKVSERKRRRLERCLFELNESTKDLPRDPENPDAPDRRHFGGQHHDLIGRMDDLLILCFLKEWSYSDEISEDGLGDLPAEAYRILKTECERLRPEMLPDYQVDIDPKAPMSASTGQPPE